MVSATMFDERKKSQKRHKRKAKEKIQGRKGKILHVVE
jgi:hypothetical protein